MVNLRTAFLVFATAATLFANPRINLSAGHLGAGGMGDIATNVLMVDLLRRNYPNAVITIGVAPEVEAKLQRLVPEYQPGKKEPQSIRGAVYVPLAAQPPRADFYVSFSVASQSEDRRWIASAPVAVLANEYRGGNQRLPRMAIKVSNTAAPVASLGNLDGTEVFEVVPGTHNGMGLYLSPKKPAPPHSRIGLLQALATQKSKSYGGPFDETQPVQLGFAYATLQSSLDRYYEGISLALKNKTLGGKKFVIVASHPPSEGITLPPNVEVRVFSSLPFEVTKSVIAHSDLPVFATGDVSLSLALDYEKPVFYEAHYWKSAFVSDLHLSLAQNVDARAAALLAPMLRGTEGEKKDDWEPQKSAAVPLQHPLTSELVAQAILDKALPSAINAAVGPLRQQKNLIQNIDKLIGFARTHPRTIQSELAGTRWFDATVKGLSEREIATQLAGLPAEREAFPLTARLRGAETPSLAISHKEPPDKPELRAKGTLSGDDERVALVKELVVLSGPERRQRIESLADSLVPEDFQLIVKDLQASSSQMSNWLKSVAKCREALSSLKQN